MSDLKPPRGLSREAKKHFRRLANLVEDEHGALKAIFTLSLVEAAELLELKESLLSELRAAVPMGSGLGAVTVAFNKAGTDVDRDGVERPILVGYPAPLFKNLMVVKM